MQLNSLYQLLAMREQQAAPARRRRRRCCSSPTCSTTSSPAEPRREYSIATTSQMYDPRKRRLGDRPLLEQLGLPTHILPEIVPSGTVLGAAAPRRGRGVRRRARSRSIAPACHDTASAVAAVPADGAASRRLVLHQLGHVVADGRGADRAAHQREDRSRYNYTNEGGVGGTIRFLKNIMGLWLVQECRRHWASEGHEHSYAELTQMAGAGQAVRRGDRPRPQAVPLARRHAAEDRAVLPATRASSRPTTRGEFVRTCLESLALTYRRTLEGLEDVLGRRIGVIHIVGGGTPERAAQPDDRRRLRRAGRSPARSRRRPRQHPGAGDGDGRRRRSLADAAR